MVIQSVNWLAGGPQGSGVDTASTIFGRACGYGGLWVFGRREYHSNIKGLHSYFHLRIAREPVAANVNDVNLLAAFDAETIVRHLMEVCPEGGIIVDSGQLNTKALEIATLPPEYRMQVAEFMRANGIGESVAEWLEYAKKRGIKVFPVPYSQLLNQIGQKIGVTQISKIIRMINVLTIGISLALLKYDRSLAAEAVRATFAEKEKIAEMNVIALEVAYDFAEQTFKESFKYILEKADATEQRIFLTGNQAVAMGKVLGGCRIQTYYPITPAADESEYIEAHEILKTTTGQNEAVIVLQTEDEIAAINSASGAALAGARAATSTSGPGFSLMVEGLSWAGNSEVPVVITYYQRGAPATGLPTRHGQSDLRFVMHAGHGEFPRIILCSGDIKECFYDAAKAFNYAEKYQVPVIHLIDKATANCSQTYPIFQYDDTKIDRGLLLSEKDLEGKTYMRFQFTETGISPRIPLGTKGTTLWYTGDEHNSEGHISEEPLNRRLMIEKRMKKLETAQREVPIEDKIAFYGEKNSENVVVSWGSPKGAIIEALNQLKEDGLSCGFLQIRMFSPFPVSEVKQFLLGKKRVIDLEDNYCGQAGQVVKEETGISPNFWVLKYTGRPVTTTEVYDVIKRIITGKAATREVLMYGS